VAIVQLLPLRLLVSILIVVPWELLSIIHVIKVVIPLKPLPIVSMASAPWTQGLLGLVAPVILIVLQLMEFKPVDLLLIESEQFVCKKNRYTMIIVYFDYP
jgi:hypothetical protein